jgi:hypothetical protein
MSEAGQTARNIVTAFSSQPAMLFLLLFILIVLGLVVWNGESQRSYYAELMKACSPVEYPMAQ